MYDYNLLFVCKNKSLFDKTSLLLKDNNCALTLKEDISAARAAVENTVFDMVMVDGVFGGDGLKFAVDTADNYPCAVMITVSAESYGKVFDKACAHGVFILKKPVKPDAFLTAIDWLKAASARLKRNDEKAVSVSEKVKVIKLIDRAKWTLITVLKMTESDAHRYIEKQAMDRCVPKKLIAEEILQTYK